MVLATIVFGTAVALCCGASGVRMPRSYAFWATVTMLMTLTMTSGQMWNRIRGAPNMGRDGNRMVSISPDRNQQFVYETYWVFFMYALCSVGAILLGDGAANKSVAKGRRKTCAIVGSVLFVVFFSLVISTFKTKNRQYPYSLLF